MTNAHGAYDSRHAASSSMLLFAFELFLRHISGMFRGYKIHKRILAMRTLNSCCKLLQISFHWACPTVRIMAGVRTSRESVSTRQVQNSKSATPAF